MHSNRRSIVSTVHVFLLIVALLALFSSEVQAQRRRERPAPTPTLGLEEGLMELETKDFNLKFVKASQTLAALEPKGKDRFRFYPGRPVGAASR